MSKNANLFNKVLSFFKSDIVAEQNDKVVSYRAIFDDEVEHLQGLIKKARNPRANNVRDNINPIIEPIFSKIGKKVVSNDKLEAIAPEIAQSGQIYISSILSPNDLKTNKFTLDITNSAEDATVIAEVSELLTDYFGNQLHFKEKLPKWLYESLYRHGAKAIMVVPSTTVANTKLPNSQGSFESLKIKAPSTPLSVALESFSSTTIAYNLASMENIDEECKGIVEKQSSKILSHLNDKRLFSVSDDIRSITTDEQRISSAKNVCGSMEDIQAEDFFSLNTPDKIDGTSQPGIIELPYESVVPLVIEGAPQSPVGFIVMVNEYGCPIKAKKEDTASSLDDNPSEGQRVSDLYQAFFGNTRMSTNGAAQDKSQVVENVLSEYFDSIVKAAGKNKGLGDITPELSSAVVNVLFFRTLRLLQTKFVFVPVDMMMYMAFDHNDDGTGKSMIDDIIMPLAFKNTLIVSRLLALIETSTPRKKITVDIDDSMGNVTEILRSIKSEAKKNRTTGISPDPITVIKNHNDREITVVPKRIPGVTDFSIENETVNVTYPQPDDALLEAIDNMITQQLGVTASSLNKLREDDFATSIASNNLFMSNSIVIKQNETCRAITKLMKIIIQFDSNLQSQLHVILKRNTPDTSIESKDVDPDPAKTKADKEKNKGKKKEEKKELPKEADGVIEVPSDELKQRLRDILNATKFTLPRPNIVSDKSQFVEIQEYISIVNAVVDAIFDNDLAVGDLKDNYSMVKAAVRSAAIADYIKEQNVFTDILEAQSNLPISSIGKTALSLTNIDKLVKDVVALTKAAESDDSSSKW